MGRKGGGGGEHGHGKSEHKGAANSKSANHNTAKQSAPDVVERLDAKLDRVSTLQWPQQREQIQFEVFVFVFLMVHVMVQNLNIYQLNLYNYNVDLIFYTTFILFKHIVAATLRSPDGRGFHKLSLVLLRAATQGVLALAVVMFGTCLTMQHEATTLAFLLLPWLVYILLFGRGWTVEYTPAGGEAERIPYQFKTFIFRVMESVYYCAVLPSRFVQHSYLYFDATRCTIVTLYLIANTAILFLCELVASNSVELELKTKAWSKSGGKADPKGGSQPDKGLKEDGSRIYRELAAGEALSSEPRALAAAVMILFHSPGTTLNCLLVLQLCVTVSQFVLLVCHRQWVWIFIMLISNYFVLHWVSCIRKRLAASHENDALKLH